MDYGIVTNADNGVLAKLAVSGKMRASFSPLWQKFTAFSSKYAVLGN